MREGQIYRVMDECGWMDGWLDGWIDGRMDESMPAWDFKGTSL